MSEIRRHLGAGLAWSGFLPGRPHDLLGVGVSRATLSSEPEAGFIDSAETVFELVYRARVLPYLALKPDLQYVQHPGGGGIDNATVGTLRIELAL